MGVGWGGASDPRQPGRGAGETGRRGRVPAARGPRDRSPVESRPPPAHTCRGAGREKSGALPRREASPGAPGAGGKSSTPSSPSSPSRAPLEKRLASKGASSFASPAPWPQAADSRAWSRPRPGSFEPRPEAAWSLTPPGRSQAPPRWGARPRPRARCDGPAPPRGPLRNSRPGRARIHRQSGRGNSLSTPTPNGDRPRRRQMAFRAPGPGQAAPPTSAHERGRAVADGRHPGRGARGRPGAPGGGDTSPAHAPTFFQRIPRPPQLVAPSPDAIPAQTSSAHCPPPILHPPSSEAIPSFVSPRPPLRARPLPHTNASHRRGNSFRETSSPRPGGDVGKSPVTAHPRAASPPSSPREPVRENPGGGPPRSGSGGPEVRHTHRATSGTFFLSPSGSVCYRAASGAPRSRPMGDGGEDKPPPPVRVQAGGGGARPPPQEDLGERGDGQNSSRARRRPLPEKKKKWLPPAPPSPAPPWPAPRSPPPPPWAPPRPS